MEINLKEKQMLLTLDRPMCFILKPLYSWYHQYTLTDWYTLAHFVLPPALVIKEEPWWSCHGYTALGCLSPLPRSSSSQHWKLRDRFWVIIPKIHAVYGQVMLFLPTVHSSSLPFLFWFRLTFFHFSRLKEVTLIVSLSFSYRLKDFFV